MFKPILYEATNLPIDILLQGTQGKSTPSHSKKEGVFFFASFKHKKERINERKYYTGYIKVI